MATTPVTDLLARTERPDPVLDATAVAGWPAGALDQLTRMGLLAAGSPAATAACDACGFDHVEVVRWEPGHPPRARIPCPECRVVWLDPAALARWVVRLPVLARLVASAVGAAGEVVERVPGRVWKLGPVRVAGRVWAGHLALGLTRPDAAAVVERVPELRAPHALVLVPSVVPAEALWASDRVPPVVPLCDLLALGPTGPGVDRDALARALPAAPRARAEGAGAGVPHAPRQDLGAGDTHRRGAPPPGPGRRDGGPVRVRRGRVREPPQEEHPERPVGAAGRTRATPRRTRHR
ncbi:hypothetical protein FTUN_0068 [Frigoriglobus tundricola]|uniref:Uncharacterized protein n=1 Tax=Frigoriglobus tundricola TaxID=2774151 RepID=A0A6M5YHZ1_9BACT|nr:hypothetical protein FTUN_0068 [Frigoriglobus tundricola]